MAVKVSAENFEAEVLQSNAPVVTDFYSDSCLPCKRMAFILSELEEEYDGKFKLCKVNAAVELALAERYKVLSAPTLVCFSDGAERLRKPGFANKTAIREMIDQLLEESE